MKLSSFLAWISQHLLILGHYFTLFFVLVFLLFILQRMVFSLSINMLGGRIIYLSAWLGTPFHELSHALFCLIFGHKIHKVMLFNPDKDGTLGYVTHSYNNRNLWQVMGNFFIGIAPLFGGLFAIYLTTWLLLDNAASLFEVLKSAVFNEPLQLHFSEIFSLLQKIKDLIQQTYATSPINVLVWAYCCAAISLHLSPSKEDLKGAWVGFIIFILLCLLTMMLLQVVGGHFFEFQQTINMVSMLYVIGIILASTLVLMLSILRVILWIVSFRF
ncbi:hypothetical protein E2R68_02650 [Psychromonas sp. RZ22]|uniref:hypothetical protein n=1 Tax=Psychromonas algarum TaxID=2555643 RepID=UPI001068C992|nr:hypothetical protein [Psychromonas sp. RZ22]TEW56010.1 hypothetical protein E2R68_02650 [Psychromonas sp. RZ22]